MPPPAAGVAPGNHHHHQPVVVASTPQVVRSQHQQQQVAAGQFVMAGGQQPQQQAPSPFSPTGPGPATSPAFLNLPSGLFSPPLLSHPPQQQQQQMVDGLHSSYQGQPPAPDHAHLTQSMEQQGKGEDPGGRVGGGAYQQQQQQASDLPPRFQQQLPHPQHPRGGAGVRYQHQRHPANRSAARQPPALVPTMPGAAHPRREALLPTPTQAFPVVTLLSNNTSRINTRSAVAEAVLEFECKGEAKPALSQELRNSRTAFKVYSVKGSESVVRAEYSSLDTAQSTLAKYRDRNFKVTLLMPSQPASKSPAHQKS